MSNVVHNLGSFDAGTHSPPGGGIGYAEVSFDILENGDYRVTIDNRRGSNQGYFQQNGGERIKIPGADLDEVTDLAREHIDSLEDGADLMRAWRIAAAEARATLREMRRDTDVLARS